MAEKSQKSEAINSFLDDVTQRFYGTKRSESIEQDTCVICGKPAIEFRDALSRKEFSISGMCQKCQDKVFG